ncbi:MAG TPA: non-ribosomal peptide synthetase, partial [Cyanobacteria bacterium UBA11148]|nr:non-ribosomal peptide synthetase [Cyanobacteria bacterium UBA11148]
MQVQTLQGFRLSPQQKHLWLLQHDSLAYRAQCAIQIEGTIDAKVLKQTLERIVDRHEILRTLFYRKPGIKIPIQVIADQGKISWNQVTIMGLNPRDQSDKIEQLLQEQRNVNFNFEQPSLLQLCLLTLAVDLHSLLITLPALYADSWTLKNLVKEIGKTYE